MMAARSVMRALAGTDPLIGGSGVAHPEELAALAARFERHERRLRGEPVVLPRVRLVVPDDPYDDWEVRLELVDEVDPGRWCTAEDVWDASPAGRRGGRRARPPGAPRGRASPTLARGGRRVRRGRRRARHASTSRSASSSAWRTPSGSSSRRRPSWPLAASSSSGPSASCAAGVARRAVGRPRTTRPTTPKRFGREAVVDWQLVVADDDGPAAISDAELERAERAGATLLHSGRRWVRIDPAALRRARKLLEDQIREHSPSSTR